MRTPYEQLTLLPSVIAKTVCEQEYRMQEMSEAARCDREVAKTESLRKAMTPEQVEEFACICDASCKAAYESKAKWFMQCVRRGNQGRDQLYVWLRHWMAAFLSNPDHFRLQHAA